MIYDYKHVCMSYIQLQTLLNNFFRERSNFLFMVLQEITLYLSCPKASTGPVVSVFLFMNGYPQQID